MIDADEKTKIEELKTFMESMKKDEHPESGLIEILHRAQGIHGYLSSDVMEEIAYTMEIPFAKIWGVASFYHYFNLKPVGKYVLALCLGTACYVKGAGRILSRLQEDLNLKIGETTEDKLFTLHEARCLGACGLAPVIMVNDRIYGKLTPEKTSHLLDDLRGRT
jgi:NADH:ubiquinone oxidoreductase subunit E